MEQYEVPWPLLRTLAAEGRLLLSLEFPTKLAHHVLANVLALKVTKASDGCEDL